MLERHRFLMILSGVLGLAFFIFANFDFIGNEVLFAYAQILINSFVFFSWGYGFIKAKSFFEKFVAFWGVIVPIVMALITIMNVLV